MQKNCQDNLFFNMNYSTLTHEFVTEQYGYAGIVYTVRVGIFKGNKKLSLLKF